MSVAGEFPLRVRVVHRHRITALGEPEAKGPDCLRAFAFIADEADAHHASMVYSTVRETVPEVAPVAGPVATVTSTVSVALYL